MHHLRTRVIFGLIAAVTLLAVFPGAAQARTELPGNPCGWARSAPSTYDHVIWIWGENTSYSQIIGNDQAPVFNTVARECGLATDYYGLYHPSFLNYIEATSGQVGTLPPSCDPSSTCQADWPSLFDQISASGREWRVDAESMPEDCRLTDSAETPVPLYVAHHNPAVYYPSLAADCARWAVNLDSPDTLQRQLSGRDAPAFTFVIPNTSHNINGKNFADGDAYLGELLRSILTSSAYRYGRTAVMISFDEGSGYTALRCADTPTAEDCHIPTIVIAPSIRPGTTVGTRFDHDALLRTTEDLLGIGTHLGNAANAPSMRPAFGF